MAVCSSNSKVFIRVICHKIRPAQRLAVSDAPTVIAMASCYRVRNMAVSRVRVIQRFT